MSILLSAYYPEGIVFVADKNATITPRSSGRKYVKSTATKVLAWPRQQAAVGFVGLGTLACYTMDEWMRVFIAGTRDFDDIDSMAHELRDRIESDFQRDFPPKTDLTRKQVIIHLGGLAIKGNVSVPVMYHIRNTSLDPQTGKYSSGKSTFDISEDVERDIKQWFGAKDYPARVRNRLQDMDDQRRYLWYNNGADLGAFNVFKEFIWQSLRTIQDSGFAPKFTGLGARAAFCMMAVEVFGSYFTHHFSPEDRVVGGGVNIAAVPWPK